MESKLDKMNLEDEDFDFIMPAPQQRSKEEIEKDIEYFINHPLNAKTITPEMLELPEYKALQALAYEGTPDDIAKNFKEHGYNRLNKVLMKEAKNNQKEVDEAIYCFDQALEAKGQDQGILYEIYIGRAKANILIGQFGKAKEDALQAKKYRETEQSWTILLRSRIFIEKYQEALEYGKEAQKKFADSKLIKELIAKAQNEMEKEKKRIGEISVLQTLEKDTKYRVYKNLREKKVKIGKRVHHLPEIVELNITLDKEGFLHFPVLILYDEYMATDFIQDWREDQTLKDHLKSVFSEQAPWDEENKYRINTIEVYFEADSTTPLDPKDKCRDKSNKKYVQCSLNDTLLEVLQHKHHIVPQYPVLKIICKKSAFREAFLNEI